jgi:cysteine desulfurase
VGPHIPTEGRQKESWRTAVTVPGVTARSYLDHASTSPLRPEAREALVAALDLTGDPGRIHTEGLTARVAVEDARRQVAELLGARPREVVFTGGATEAIAAACWGVAARWAERHETSPRGHQVVPAVEHSAVRQAAARHGDVTIVPVDAAGRVDVDELVAAIRDDTVLVHLQWGNHEVGTLQLVTEAVGACRQRGVPVHVDAAQAVGREPVRFRDLGADLLSVSAHKFGGPPGVGALLVRQGLRLPPLLVGGDQERARRAGLENVPALVAFGATCAALSAPAPGRGPSGRPSPSGGPWPGGDGTDRDGTDREGTDRDGTGPSSGDRTRVTDAQDRTVAAQEAVEQRRLTDRIAAAVGAAPGLEGLSIYGDPDRRLPHILCLGVEGIEPQAVLLGLDRAGVAAHSGSACSSESLEPSPVLEAMGVDAHHSLRLSVGWSTTDADVDRLLDALPRVLADLRTLASGRPPSV